MLLEEFHRPEARRVTRKAAAKPLRDVLSSARLDLDGGGEASCAAGGGSCGAGDVGAVRALQARLQPFVKFATHVDASSWPCSAPSRRFLPVFHSALLEVRPTHTESQAKRASLVLVDTPVIGVLGFRILGFPPAVAIMF